MVSGEVVDQDTGAVGEVQGAGAASAGAWRRAGAVALCSVHQRAVLFEIRDASFSEDTFPLPAKRHTWSSQEQAPSG